MTDQELLDLLEQKTPDELTVEEVELLRGRLADSPELRETLLGQLQMETYLTAALGRINLSPEQIVARAQKQVQPNNSSVIVVLGVLLCLPLVLLAGSVLWNAIKPKPAEIAEVPVAEPGPVSPAPDPQTPKPEVPPVDPGPAVQPVQPTDAGPMTPMPPPAAPPKPAGPPPLPWQAAVDPAVPPAPFKQVAFAPFDMAKSLPQRDDLKAWFENVPGYPLNLSKQETRFGPCGAIEGVARLKSPWPDGAALRLSLENFNRLRIHFYSGERGVSLIYYEDQNYRWAAYATTREAGKVVPKTWAITATDDERARRAELRQGGPLELRYHGGQVLLSRGDIVLVSAALPGAPTEVFFEGRAAFKGLSLVRTDDGPSPLDQRPATLEIPRPADLPWTPSKPDFAQLEKLPDGAVRLVGNKAKERVHWHTPLPRHGLQEVVLQLDDITPGSGVLFTYKEGEPQQVIRFYHDRRSKQLYAQVRHHDDECEREFEQPNDKAVPVLQKACFVKFVYGCGNLRWWLSSDGVHWAQPEIAIDSVQPEPTGLALQVVAGRENAQITLKRIAFHELTGLTALASAGHLRQAVALPRAGSLGIWQAQCLANRPEGIATGDWRRACALATLGAGAVRELAYPLLEALLDDAAAGDVPFDKHLAALSDANLLCLDLRDGPAMRLGIPRRILELGLRGAEQSQAPAWSRVRPAAMTLPFTSHVYTPPDLERFIRWETIQRATTGPPAETFQFCRELRLFDQQRFSPLVDWAEAAAVRGLAGRPSGATVVKLKDSWREPLIEELSKETYNATTELQAVLESEAWDEAARLVTNVDPEIAPGVAPYLRDRSLLASLPVAVRLMLEDYPQLRQSLGNKFGPLARLRIGQSISSGDAATVEMATIQFSGTDAAGDAHRWLGDRALASGWFDRAIAEYHRALQVTPSLLVELAPRMRLAAAMQGRDEGQPVTGPVRFNELAMSPAEFEALVTEMRTRNSAATLVQPAAATPIATVPAARKYEVHNRSRLDGPVGDKPQEEVGRRTNQFRVPWADRQIATVLEGDVLYVSNRFQIAAYNLTTGQRMWQSQPPPGPIGRSQDWALIAMQPLVTASHIFARQLYSPNPLLAAFEKSSGKLLWVAEPQPREYYVSDPVIVQGQLGALSIAIQEEQQGVLRWNILDPETGELQQQRDLIRLRNTWGARACCEVKALDDSIVVVLGGLTMALDPSGNVRWVRKHVTLPADEDPRWVLQRYHRPLIAGQRMFVAQPGVRTVDCLDTLTGRLHWSAVLPEVVGLVGLSADRLVVCNENEIVALDQATGQSRWRFPVSELHSFQLLDDAALLLAHRERPADRNDQWLTRLTWLDAATGEPTATTLLPNLVDADARLGPLVPYKDRVFTFFGRGQHDPNRDLVELVPAGEPEKPTSPQLASDPWRQAIPAKLTRAGFTVLPDWQLVSGQEGDRTGLVPEIHGEREVLGVRSTGPWPIVLGRGINLPSGGRPRLRLRIGNDGGQHWKLEARFGEQVLKTEEIKDETHKDRWKTIEVNLTPAAGKSGWLTVRAQSTGGDHVLWWKSAEVVF